MAQEVNPTVSELVLQICGISEFLAKLSSMIAVHKTNDVDGSQKIINPPPRNFRIFGKTLATDFVFPETFKHWAMVLADCAVGAVWGTSEFSYENSDIFRTEPK